MHTALEKLGIRPSKNVSLGVILGENFNGRLYGLDNRQMERVEALREVVASYVSERSRPVTQVLCTSDAVRILHPALGGLSHEEVMVIFLNNGNTVLHVESLFRGSVAGVSFSPREVISRALCVNAAAIIISHNHPSGCPEPTEEDIKNTNVLLKACEMFEILLLDHIIISRDSYYSFVSERCTKMPADYSINGLAKGYHLRKTVR